jgi:hypothetical protein
MLLCYYIIVLLYYCTNIVLVKKKHIISDVDLRYFSENFGVEIVVILVAVTPLRIS